MSIRSAVNWRRQAVRLLIREAFAEGEEPTLTCALHPGEQLQVPRFE